MHGAGAGTEQAGSAEGPLARRVMAGDRQAEAELCRRLRPRLRAYGLRHLRGEAAAADLAHDVLLIVLERLRAGAVRDPDRIAAFVLAACRTAAVHRAGTERRRAELLAREAATAEPSAPPVEPLPRARLAGCLQGLAERERAVVLSTFYAGQAAAEIARDQALSEGHVRVLRHRALARLRGCLGVTEQGEAA